MGMLFSLYRRFAETLAKIRTCQVHPACRALVLEVSIIHMVPL